ncbi:MAG: hypothetical protein AAGG01_02405 [Planctomycetota bacterium]
MAGASALLVSAGAASAQQADADLAPVSSAPRPLLSELAPIIDPVPPGGFAAPDEHHSLPPWMSTGSAQEHRTLAKSTTSASGALEAPDLSRIGGVDEMLAAAHTGALVDRGSEGEVWVRTLHQRTRFGGGSVTVLPVFGPAAVDESPVEFEVVGAQVGATSLAAGSAAAPLASADDRRVTLQRSGFTEDWNLRSDSIEQTFIFNELPTRGELSVTMRVTTDLVAGEDGGALVFEQPGLGGVRYGAAIAFDAAGQTVDVQRTFDGEHITLTVPSWFVAEAQLPLTIDPPVTSWVLTGSFADDSEPAICYAKDPGRFYIAWEEYTSQTNADCYLTSVTLGGVQSSVVAVETGSDFWARPRLGYVPANDRILVAASVTLDGPGTGSGRIEGRLFDAVTESAASAAFFISSFGSEKVDPVVGGTNFESTFNNHFLVAWSRILSPTRYSIEYRIVDWDGSAVTPIEIVTSEEGARNRQPAVSASHGDTLLNGDFWTLAWNENPASSIFALGRIKARRVVWNGNPALGGTIFTVNNSTRCSLPTVSSQLDSTYGLIGSRPSLVGYSIADFTNGLRPDVVVNVVNESLAHPANLVTFMEDFDDTISQGRPTIASDGASFVLAYQEIYYAAPTGTDWDMYMNSGSVVRDGNDLKIALAERHKLMDFSAQPSIAPQVAMIQDGDATVSSDDGFVVWYRDLGNPGGEIQGSSVDAATLQGSTRRAVGEQYCDANQHSGNPGQVGPEASWLWIEGDQSAGVAHTARCVEMPPNVFGYLLCSRSTGDVNMPAGSQGRLCLGGSIGRYTAQIGASGAAGAFNTTIRPSLIPQPTSLVVAQPGETWNFQVWHRDAIGGTATSNFSNACALHFR